MIQLSHFQSTLFSLLTVRQGLTVFQNCLLSVTRLTSTRLKKSFLAFCRSLTQIFCYFLCATCDDIVLSCLTLFNNLDFVMIAFLKFLFANAAWLHLTCFSFNGAYLSDRYWAVALSKSRCLVWTFFDSNSFRRSFLSELLSNFYCSFYIWLHVAFVPESKLVE